MSFEFFLGTHVTTWLWTTEGVPLFVSYRQLRDRVKPFPPATAEHAFDSGGFTELSQPPEGSPAREWHDWSTCCHIIPTIRVREPHRWQVTPEQYVADMRRIVGQLGRDKLRWIAPQDWMCEPWIIRDTAQSVAEHQVRSVLNFLELRRLAPDLPFIPVLQGWALEDYHRHADMYATAGVDLTSEPVVGVGSVCRRESSWEAARIFESLAGRGLKLHGFGVKTDGLARYVDSLISSDSLAWSYGARQKAFAEKKRRDAGEDVPLPPCGKKTCANCAHHAFEWRERILKRLETRQLTLWTFGDDAA